jgi:hypothetical protein
MLRRHRGSARRSASRGRPRDCSAARSDHGTGRSRTRHTNDRRPGRTEGTCGHLDAPCPLCLSIRNDGRHRLAGDEDCYRALFPFAPGTGAAGKIAPVDRYFGGPADSGSPVALRPSLTGGLPFRLLPEPRMPARAGEVKRSDRLRLPPTRLQPRRYLRREAFFCRSGDLADPACLDGGDRVGGSENRLRPHDVVHTFLAQTAKTVPGLQDPAVTSSYDADGARPSATVADAVSLSPELLDANRDLFHACHPLSGAIGITLFGRQLNMRDRARANGCRIIPDAGRVIPARTPRSRTV